MDTSAFVGLSITNLIKCEMKCTFQSKQPQLIVPIFDKICRRAMNFISTCYQLGSELVSYVINRGLYFEHMNLLIGRNAVFCSLRYGISLNHNM